MPRAVLTACSVQSEMLGVRVPDFWGASFLELATLPGVGQAFTIEVWFLSRAPNGLLLYNGGRDFVALGLEDGFIRFRFDLGGGVPGHGLVAIS